MYIIPYLLVYFTCVSCSPLLTRFFSSIRCTRPITQRLDPAQALNPNLNDFNSFGYIYSMRNSMMEFDSDIEIQSASNPAAEWLPSNALALLTHISFNEPTSRLILKSRFSNTNFDKLVLSARNITTVDISFATFAFDALDGTWYDRLKNSDAGISGKIEHIETVQRFEQGQQYFQEVLIEISPSSKEENQSIKYMTSNDMQTLKEIKWSHNSKNVCKPGLIANQGKSYFNELFESAILL